MPFRRLVLAFVLFFALVDAGHAQKAP